MLCLMTVEFSFGVKGRKFMCMFACPLPVCVWGDRRVSRVYCVATPALKPAARDYTARRPPPPGRAAQRERARAARSRGLA